MQRLRAIQFLDAHAILICFAIDSPETFKNATSKVLLNHLSFRSVKANNRRQWYEEVSGECRSDVPIFLVGCKSDLRSGHTCFISEDEAEIAASKIGARGYYECSAYSAEGLDRLIDATARASLEVVIEGEDGIQEKKRCVIC